jgi:hypothetical protein
MRAPRPPQPPPLALVAALLVAALAAVAVAAAASVPSTLRMITSAPVHEQVDVPAEHRRIDSRVRELDKLLRVTERALKGRAKRLRGGATAAPSEGPVPVMHRGACAWCRRGGVGAEVPGG